MRKAISIFLLMFLSLLMVSDAAATRWHRDIACRRARGILVVKHYQHYRDDRDYGVKIWCERTRERSRGPKRAWWLTFHRNDWLRAGCLGNNQVITLAWYSKRWVRVMCFSKDFWRNPQPAMITKGP